MDLSPEQARYRVRLETRKWLVIDATMDNEVSVEAEDGDPRGVVDLGMSIRRAGWDQVPGWPRDVQGFETWPAPGQTSTISLSRPQWDLVLSALERWAAVSDRSPDPGSADDAAQSRAIAELVRVQLAEQE
ncbi:MAG TPA: hypothetical protein VFC19_09475 [Candidatus Limnocylindrales bacterium]|nr:hypothetical protein [Candidatus Limnocylindrales bacterium]